MVYFRAVWVAKHTATSAFGSFSCANWAVALVEGLLQVYLSSGLSGMRRRNQLVAVLCAFLSAFSFVAMF